MDLHTFTPSHLHTFTPRKASGKKCPRERTDDRRSRSWERGLNNAGHQGEGGAPLTLKLEATEQETQQKPLEQPERLADSRRLLKNIEKHENKVVLIKDTLTTSSLSKQYFFCLCVFALCCERGALGVEGQPITTSRSTLCRRLSRLGTNRSCCYRVSVLFTRCESVTGDVCLSCLVLRV